MTGSVHPGRDAAAAAPLLDVAGLRIAAPGRAGPVHPVDGLDLAVQAGERVALVGESGSGKSLTALAIMGLLPRGLHQAGGTIRFEGRTLEALGPRARRKLRGRAIGMVFQEPLTALNPYRTIGEQVAEAVRIHGGGGRRALAAKASALLEEAGLPDAALRLGAHPHELSGGQRQRVVIAMALAGEPRLLLADEPTTSLDVTVQARILDRFEHLSSARGMAVLLITHDLAVAARTAARIAVAYAGRVVEDGPAGVVARAPRHPYTRGLLATLPRPDARRGARFPVIPGTPPGPGEAGPGCAFAARCPLREPRCDVEAPVGRVAAPGHRVACHLDPP